MGRHIIDGGGWANVHHHTLVNLSTSVRPQTLLPVLSTVRVGNVYPDCAGCDLTSQIAESMTAKDSTPWSAPAWRRFGHLHAVSNCVTESSSRRQCQATKGQSAARPAH